MRSRKPEAKAFRKWVTSEVLPKIRKTGSYGMDPIEALKDPAIMRGLLLSYSETVIGLENKVKEQAPKVAIADQIHTANGMTYITDTVKSLRFDRLKRDHDHHRRQGRTVVCGERGLPDSRPRQHHRGAKAPG